jgi:hypothetical protein
VKHSGEAAPVAPDEQPEIPHIELKLRPKGVRWLVMIPTFQATKAFKNQLSAATWCHPTVGRGKIMQTRSRDVYPVRRRPS